MKECPTVYRAELDSNCDTCTFGKGAWVVHDTGQTVSVDPFLDSLGSVKQVKIITAAVAYDDPTTYQTYILFFPQSLYIPSLKRHLLCPNQMRTNGITINNTAHTHSIIAEADETFEEVHIPLELEGQTTSYFLTRKPTRSEVDNTDYSCIHVHMTPTYRWEPADTTVSNNESTIRASLASDTEPRERGRKLHAVSTGTNEFSVFTATSATTTTPQPTPTETTPQQD